MALTLMMSVYPADLHAPPPISMEPVIQFKKKPPKLPQSRVIKFLNEDIWAIKAYLKQCYEHNNAKVCATADPNFKEAMSVPPITIVFKITF